MSRDLLVVGGFSEGKSVLRGIQHAAEDFEDFDNANIRTYAWAIEHRAEIGAMAKDALVVTHSAGIVAVKNAVASPQELAAFNGPEPTTEEVFFNACVEVTRSHLNHLMENKYHLKTLVSHAGEFIAHGRKNISHRQEILSFSTKEYLKKMTMGGVVTWMLTADHDEFFPTNGEYAEDARNAGVKVRSYPGDHHELLTTPSLIGLIYED